MLPICMFTCFDMEFYQNYKIYQVSKYFSNNTMSMVLQLIWPTTSMSMKERCLPSCFHRARLPKDLKMFTVLSSTQGLPCVIQFKSNCREIDSVASSSTMYSQSRKNCLYKRWISTLLKSGYHVSICTTWDLLLFW